jgi:uncharacterized membrane protein
MQIYVHRDNKQLGPFSETELQELINAGSISLQDPVWWQGQADWVPLAQTSLAAKLTAPALGAAAPPPPAVSAGGETSKLALWSMICGIGAFFCGIAFLPAIILGHMGRAEIKKNPSLKGSGMALAGLILGYLYSVVFIAIVVISVLIALGNQVKAVTAQQSARDISTNSTDQSTTSTPASTTDSGTTTTDSGTTTTSTNATPTVTP